METATPLTPLAGASSSSSLSEMTSSTAGGGGALDGVYEVGEPADGVCGGRGVAEGGGGADHLGQSLGLET